MSILSFFLGGAHESLEGSYKGGRIILTTKNTIEHLMLTVYKN